MPPILLQRNLKNAGSSRTGKSVVYGDDDCAFEPNNVGSLENALTAVFLLSCPACGRNSLRCASDVVNSEVGPNTNF